MMWRGGSGGRAQGEAGQEVGFQPGREKADNVHCAGILVSWQEGFH